MTTLLLAACSGLSGGNHASLSHAQVQSLQKNMPLAEVERQFGPPHDRKTVDDKIRAIAYSAENARGEVEELRIAFDEEGHVVRWTLSPRTDK